MMISSRFNGPPDSANGGYTCGLLAAHLEGPVEVTLRQPPPLDRELRIERQEGQVKLRDGDSLVATARCTSLELARPEPVSFAQAQAASNSYIGHTHHPFPTCFVCGPKRPNQDGLALFAGGIDEEIVAAAWVPSVDFDDGQGRVRPEFLWCALDCPGAFAVDQNLEQPRVLGRLIGNLVARPAIGEECVVIGWPVGFERRKAFAGTAVYDSQGRLCGEALATWIAI